MALVKQVLASSENCIKLDLAPVRRSETPYRPSFQPEDLHICSKSRHNVYAIDYRRGYGTATVVKLDGSNTLYSASSYFFSALYLVELGLQVRSRFEDTLKYREYEFLKSFDESSIKSDWKWGQYLTMKVFSLDAAAVYDGINWVKVNMPPQQESQRYLQNKYLGKAIVSQQT